MNDTSVNSPLEDVFRLTGTQKRAFKKLGLLTVRDLLYHFPARYGETAEAKPISALSPGDTVLVSGRLSKLEKTRAWKKKTPMTKAVLEDATGKINVIWFHQPYIAKMLHEGSLVGLKGKVQKGARGLYLANPDTEQGAFIAPSSFQQPFLSQHSHTISHDSHYAGLAPVYPESRGITSRWFYYALKKVFAQKLHEELEDPIPKETLKRYNLPALRTALIWIHEPKKKTDAEVARKRFAFEEVFFIQLARLKERLAYARHETFSINPPPESVEDFTGRFSFELTGAQKRAISAIIADFKKEKPMSRLLEGDVGSGKTAVAAATAYAVVTSRPNGQDFGNLQVAYMAPTEILAKQHFESFMELFNHLPIQIGLVTSSGCKKFPSKLYAERTRNGRGTDAEAILPWTDISKSQLLKWVRNGEIPILIGTHSLIQKTVKFKHLAYVIIDEQHKFGTMQRYALARKEKRVPHLLSMTATPIPRTLALTVYGDLDLTLLDEMPPGRKRVITKIVPRGEREEMYAHIREELAAGRQAYVICPKIELGDGKLEVKNVKDEAERLRKDVLPKQTIEILHSKIKPKEKEEIMQKFLAHEIDILVSTSVVEVGVNVPNATVIIIEGAERFGLAQLHQLRGRVLRSTHQSYCYLLSERSGLENNKRLKALQNAKNGFDLAEEDLKIRGAGELSGRQQWGITDVGMEAIRNLKMVEAARREGQAFLQDDPLLAKSPLLQKKIEEKVSNIHFE